MDGAHAGGTRAESRVPNRNWHNLEQVIDLYKAAVQKGENVIGYIENNAYVPAQKRLMDYYDGKAPTFAFSGSYKDDGDVAKHFGSQYGPSRYERMAVPDAEIQNYLSSAHPPEVAQDIYLRKFAGGRSKLFYKTDPLEDYQDHQIKLQDHKTKGLMDEARFRGIELSNEHKAFKLDEERRGAGGAGAGGGNLIENILTHSQTGEADWKDGNGTDKTLPHSGYDLNRFRVPGKNAAHIAELPLYGDQNSVADWAEDGIEKNKGWMGVRRWRHQRSLC